MPHRVLKKKTEAGRGRKMTEDELRRHKEHLEEIVAAKTAELEAANDKLKRENEQRRRAEEHWHAEHSRLSAIMDHLPSCHIFIKDRQSRFMATNAAHLRLLGLADPSGVLGKTDFDLFPPEIARSFFESEQEMMRTGRPILNLVEKCVYPDGSVRHMLTNKIPLRDRDGRITGLVGMSMDITDRVCAELAVREERNMLRTLIDALPQWIYLKDTKSRFILANRRCAERMLLKSPDELIGKTDFDFTSPESARQYAEEEAAILATGLPVIGRRDAYKTAEGEEVILEISKLPLRDSSGNIIGILGFNEEVTERCRQQEAIRASNEMLRSVLNSITVRVFWKDRTSVYLGCNASFAKARGLDSPEDVVGRTDFDLASTRSEAEAYRAVDRRVMETDRAECHFLETQVSPDGSFRWLDTTKVPLHDASGKVMGVLGVCEDVTERRKAERQLREERNLLRKLIDNIPHAIYVKDAQGRFLIANRLTAIIMGAKSPDELIGKTDFDFYPETAAREFRADEERIMASGDPLIQKDEPARLPDGRTLWILTTKLPLRDSQGRLAGIIGVGLDDTKRREEELRRRELEEHLRHSEKMKAIGHLAGGVAHDFNNQLAAIMGSAELIRETAGSSEAARHAETIVTACRRAADLTGKLLAFARRGRYQSVSVDMHSIVREVVALLERSIDKRIKIVQHLNAGSSVVRGDPAQLQSALLNLCINARDAIGHEGEIVISTEAAIIDEKASRRPGLDVKPGRYIAVSVTDTGSGMDEETKKHIFEPFFTTKKEGEGTGMGLAAVYGAVKNHDGGITFTSEIGYGTKFTIWLPLADETAAERRPEALKPAAIPPATVMVVDDEDIVRTTLKVMLERLGCKVVACADGEEAMELYRSSWREIQLVLLDMVMPRMGGADMFRAMKAVNPDVRAILVSGYSLAGEAQQALNDGAKGFLQKPCAMASLSEAVARALS